MPVTQLPIANGFYVSDSLPIAAQECTNWYPNIVQGTGLNQETLFGTPGLEQLATSGTLENENRGAHEMAGKPYFVNGDRLYRLDETVVDSTSTYALTFIGDIAGTARVSMADNGTQLMILVPGGNGYIYNHVTDTFAQITDSDFTANGNPQFVVFIDGYFLVTTDSKKFIISAINDGLSYNALDFGTAESDPDDIVAPVVYKNQLFISGGETFEAFQNIGGADFPFQRTGLFLQKGCYAPYSLVNAQDTFMWVGGGENEGPAIWALSGNSTVKVSTTAIDSLLSKLTETALEGIYSWAYASKGAYFIGFSLPSTTLVYDITSKRWHERKSFLSGALGAFRISSVVKAYNKIICGDSIDGRIGSLDPDVYTEYGNPIIRRVATQPFQNNMQSIFFPSLELTIESGVGNVDVPDPVIVLERSKDGKTWGEERARSMGKIGEYNRRAIWRRNGRASRFEVFRFTLTDAVKPVIIQLTANIIGGDK
jgi:hypothetical protein